jgi:hypothetical protein
VTIRGGYSYHAMGPVTGAGFTILADSKGNGVASIHGSGTIVGPKGGPAFVAVNVDRMFNWTFGKIDVNDPSSGIDLHAFRMFGTHIWRFGNSARVNGSWWTFDMTKGLRPFTITAIVTDNG